MRVADSPAKLVFFFTLSTKKHGKYHKKNLGGSISMILPPQKAISTP